MIWDGAVIHRSEVVKTFLKERPGRVHLERLPAYSPELNPVELVWRQLKRSLKNQVFTNLDTLKTAVFDQLKILEKDPEVIKSFFYKKVIGFITSKFT